MSVQNVPFVKPEPQDSFAIPPANQAFIGTLSDVKPIIKPEPNDAARVVRFSSVFLYDFQCAHNAS